MGALFGAPSTDAVGNQVTMIRVQFLRNGDKIAKPTGWRELNWNGPTHGYAVVSSIEPVESEGGAVFGGRTPKRIFFASGEEPIVLSQNAYVKIMARG